MNKKYFVSYSYRTRNGANPSEKYDSSVKFGNAVISYASRLETFDDLDDLHIYLERFTGVNEPIIINFFEL